MKIEGKAISKGYAKGELVVWENEYQQVEYVNKIEVSTEKARFLEAKDTVKEKYHLLYEQAREKVGEAEAQIFDAYQLLLEDVAYQEEVIAYMKDHNVCAQNAVKAIKEQYMDSFSHMQEEYMRERAADIEDISNRLIDVLCNHKQNIIKLKRPCILAVKNLSASDTIQMDRSKILGIILDDGAQYSHTAILLRSMGIPTVCVDNLKEIQGNYGLLDGFSGTIYIDPSQEEIAHMEKIIATLKLQRRNRMTKKISLLANISGEEDAIAAIENGADGIGLYRSEYLFLKQRDYPDEETQFYAYKKIAEIANGKRVVIRTLDIGSDKRVSYIPMQEESNPAMGIRGIRFSLQNQEIFVTQLKAILRASKYGTIAVMFPMIASIDEVKAAKDLLERAKEMLRQQKIAFSSIEVGVMIETPAAVMISEELAKEVDFLSIGTNDLSQYTLAMDRTNAALASSYDAFHPAIQRMIKMVIDHGHKHGRKVSICGELAADASYTAELIKMGIDALSIPPVVLKDFQI